MRKAFALKTLMMTCLVPMLLTGCTRRYVVTMVNGSQVYVIGKPKLERGEYVAKDTAGQPVRIPQGGVREIAPASMHSSSKNSGFQTSPTKQ